MRCWKCGNELRGTADDYANGLCWICKSKQESEMKTIEECIRENCNVEFDKYTGEEMVVSSLAAVSIAMEEYAKQFSGLITK